MDSVSVLLTGLKGWVSPIISVLLIPLILLLISKIKENGKADAKRAENLKSYVSEQMTALKAYVNEQLTALKIDLEKKIENHEKRLSILEHDAVMNEEFLQVTSGWRTEINRLSDLITKQMSEVMKNIIDIWKVNR